jgi:hypothetical protein
MKRLLIIIAAMLLAASLNAQDWEGEEIEVEEKYPYLKDTYEEVFDLPFEEVWEAAIESIEEINCMIISKNPRQTDEGLLKGVIKSDFCVFARGDTTYEGLTYYSLKDSLPYIRGAVWKNGRMQYRWIIKEDEDRMVHVRLIGEISGMESHVTRKVHFWKSNGFFETKMFERLRNKLGLTNTD